MRGNKNKKPQGELFGANVIDPVETKNNHFNKEKAV